MEKPHYYMLLFWLNCSLYYPVYNMKNISLGIQSATAGWKSVTAAYPAGLSQVHEHSLMRCCKQNQTVRGCKAQSNSMHISHYYRSKQKGFLSLNAFIINTMSIKGNLLSFYIWQCTLFFSQDVSIKRQSWGFHVS